MSSIYIFYLKNILVYGTITLNKCIKVREVFMKNRIIALFLLVSLVFGMTSCDRGQEIPPKDRPLVVESEDVVYTDEGIAEIADGLVKTADILMPILGYPKLKDDERAELHSLTRDRIIPIAREIPIYESELRRIFDILVEELSAISADNTDTDRLGIIADAYARMSAHVDSRRLGELIFELDLEWMGDSLERAKDRYDRYGYSYYLEDIEKYTALISDAEQLGSEAFSDALSVFMFIASASFGTVIADGSTVGVKAADILVIMKKQGEKFASLGINEAQWQTVAAMCEELIPDAISSAIHAKVTWTLDDEDYFTSAAAVMPDVIDFYEIFTSEISPEAAEGIEEGTELSLALSICRELARNKSALTDLLSAMEEKIPGASEAQISIMTTYEKEGYAEFTSLYLSSKEELIASIEAFVNEPTEDSIEELKRTVIGFAASINPVVAYVYMYL